MGCPTFCSLSITKLKKKIPIQDKAQLRNSVGRQEILPALCHRIVFATKFQISNNVSDIYPEAFSYAVA
jgi:hypothetical protein